MLRGTLWNVLGLALPSLIALPALAVMARVLGVEKFGLFALAFALLGYAGIFDGGLTRAVTREIAMHDDDNCANRLIVGTATWTALLLASTAAFFLFALAPNVVRVLNVSPAQLEDAMAAFRLVAIAIPPYILSLVWFAYLEGKQRFFHLNVLKTITGSSVAVLPAVGVLLHPSLTAALGGLLLARVLSMVVAYQPCHKDFRGKVFQFDKKSLKHLLSFGGWMTVSNIVSPLMVYADRFVLSSVVGANRVAFYTAPSDAVARMSIIPGAAARAMFPIFSKLQQDAAGIAKAATQGLLLVTILIALPFFIYAEEVLNIWLGDPYGQQSATIMRVLLVGFIFNALAQIPFARIQAAGNSRLTAMIHLAEFLPYALGLFVLVYLYGLVGSAIAWTIRVFVDYLLLVWFSRLIEHKR